MVKQIRINLLYKVGSVDCFENLHNSMTTSDDFIFKIFSKHY